MTVALSPSLGIPASQSSSSSAALQQQIQALEKKLAETDKPGRKRSDASEAAVIAKEITAAKAQVAALTRQAQQKAQERLAAAAGEEQRAAVAAGRSGATIGGMIDTYA